MPGVGAETGETEVGAWEARGGGMRGSGRGKRRHGSWSGWRRSPKRWRAGGTPRRGDPRDDGLAGANVLERRAPGGPAAPGGPGAHRRRSTSARLAPHRGTAGSRRPNSTIGCAPRSRSPIPASRSSRPEGDRRDARHEGQAQEGEYPKVWGADLFGQVSQGNFLVREPVNPDPDRACHRRLTPQILVLPGAEGSR